MLCRKSQSNTGLPAYSDTGYSDILASVTVFLPIKGSPYTGNPGYSDIPLTVTLFGRPNTVTVSGKACTMLILSCIVPPSIHVMTVVHSAVSRRIGRN